MFYGDARRAVVCAVRPSGSTMTGGPRGYQVSAVSPNAKQVEGDPSYPNVKSVPGGVHAVVIGTRPALAGDTMRECAERASSRCGCIAAREWEASPRLLPSTARTRDHHHRRRLPMHVRSHRRSRAQGDVSCFGPDRQSPQAGVNAALLQERKSIRESAGRCVGGTVRRACVGWFVRSGKQDGAGDHGEEGYDPQTTEGAGRHRFVQDGGACGDG